MNCIGQNNLNNISGVLVSFAILYLVVIRCCSGDNTGSDKIQETEHRETNRSEHSRDGGEKNKEEGEESGTY